MSTTDVVLRSVRPGARIPLLLVPRGQPRRAWRRRIAGRLHLYWCLSPDSMPARQLFRHQLMHSQIGCIAARQCSFRLAQRDASTMTLRWRDRLFPGCRPIAIQKHDASAPCSSDPDSRRSDNIGRLSDALRDDDELVERDDRHTKFMARIFRFADLRHF